MIFVDSSALAKLYLEEDGRETVLGVLGRMQGWVFASEFVALEVLTTLRTQFRRVARARYQQHLAQFQRDFTSRLNVRDVDSTTLRRARTLAVGPREARARAMDVLHVACALDVQASFPGRTVTMVSSDRDLLALARSVGLRTFDPLIEPLAALPKRSA